VSQLLRTIEDVREFTNPTLRVSGIIATMFDSRTTEGRRVLEDVASQSGLRVLEPPIPRSVRFSEASTKGRSIVEQSPKHTGAQAYRTLVGSLR
jgi:chromosome partitioning protein